MSLKLDRATLTLLAALGVGLLLHLPGLRPIFRFAPAPELAGLAYVLTGLAFTAVVFRHRAWLQEKLNTPWALALLLVGLTLVSALVYPLADGLSAQGRGSDGDDALKVGLASWLQFGNPYYLRTYFGNQLSPGPGWIALVAPLSLSGTYALLPTVALAAAAAAARAALVSWGAIALFTALLFSSLAAWEMTVTGIDHIPLGLLLLAITLRALHTRSVTELVVLALAVGALSTGRVVFFYWPLLLGFLLIPRRGWRIGLGVGLLGFVSGLLWHLWGWATAPEAYHPWHVVGKTEAFGADGGQSFLLATLVICAVTSALMLKNWFRWSPLWHLWLGVAVPLACAGVGDLVGMGLLAHANLASYLMLGAPLLLAALLWQPKAAARSVQRVSPAPSPHSPASQSRARGRAARSAR